jgi:hypothetical protein
MGLAIMFIVTDHIADSACKVLVFIGIVHLSPATEFY